MEGLTGPIKFDARGFRTDFNMDIIELKQEGLIKVNATCFQQRVPCYINKYTLLYY